MVSFLESEPPQLAIEVERTDSAMMRHNEMDRTLHVSSTNAVAAAATIEQEEDDVNPSPTTATNATHTSAEELMLLLRRVRHNDARIRHVNLHRKRLPVAYLRALFSVLVSNNNHASIVSLSHSTPMTSSHVLHLVRLRLSQSGVNDAVMNVVADFVACNTSVVDLDLSYNDISDASGLALAAAIRQQRTSSRSSKSSKGVLQRLDLSGTLLGPASIAALCTDAIPGSAIGTLKLASLPDAVGTAVGLAALSALLQHANCPLRKLDVRNCHLGNGGASTLALALHRQHEQYMVVQQTAVASADTDSAEVGTLVQPLQALYLGRNQIGDKGLTDLVTVLESNTTLVTLDVQANVDITNVSAERMVQCLQRRNHALRKLKLRHCISVSDDVKERLLDALLVNAHGPDLARATKRAWHAIVQSSTSSSSRSTTAAADATPGSHRIGDGSSCRNHHDALFHHLRAMIAAHDEVESSRLPVSLSSLFPTTSAATTAAHAAAATSIATLPAAMIDHSESSLGDGCEEDEDDENDQDTDEADSGKEKAMVKQVFPARCHQHCDDDDDDVARPKLSAELVQPCHDDETESQCVICYETTCPGNDKDHDSNNRDPCILLPCLHCNCCTSCAEKLEQCHMCRGTIVKVVPWHYVRGGGTGIAMVRTSGGTATTIPSWRRGRRRAHYPPAPRHTAQRQARASSVDSVEVTLIRRERRR
jgi:Leucine Rich repeat